MPGKSRHGKGKQYQSKKSKAKQRHASMAPHQQVAAAAPQPATPPREPAATTNEPAAPVTKAVSRYPYISSELRRIGILAGIIIVVLIILSQVLS